MFFERFLWVATRTTLRFCPNTGTPVPGGLEFSQAVLLLDVLVRSGRTIVGLDLNEVAPGEDEWDANVGARTARAPTPSWFRRCGRATA